MSVRCSHPLCKAWCITPFTFCKKHAPSSSDLFPITSGPLDSDPYWQTCKSIIRAPNGSRDLIIVQTLKGHYVCKNSQTIVAEAYANSLASTLSIPSPECRVIPCWSPEIALFRTVVNMPNDDTWFKPFQTKFFVLISQYLPNAHDLATHSSNVTRDNLIDIGKIITFDVLTNNYDRIPIIWSNEGNSGNIMFDATGNIKGIDHLLVDIKKPDLADNYLKKVDDFITRVMENDFTVMNPLSIVLDTSILDEHERNSLLEGALKCIHEIGKLRSEDLHALKSAMACKENSEYSFQWSEGVDILDISFLSKVLAVFHSHYKDVAGTILPLKPLTLSPPDIDYKSAVLSLDDQMQAVLQSKEKKNAEMNIDYSLKNETQKGYSYISETRKLYETPSMQRDRLQAKVFDALSSNSERSLSEWKYLFLGEWRNIKEKFNLKFTSETVEPPTIATEVSVLARPNLECLLAGLEKAKDTLTVAPPPPPPPPPPPSLPIHVINAQADEWIKTNLNSSACTMTAIPPANSLADILPLLVGPVSGRILVALDFDQTVKHGGKVRGGVETIVALTTIIEMGISCIIVTANEPTVAAVATVAAEVSKIGLGEIFDCAPMDKTKLVKALKICNLRSPKDLTVKLATLMALESDALKVSELHRVIRNEILRNTVTLKAKTDEESSRPIAISEDLSDVLSFYFAATSHVAVADGPLFLKFVDNKFVSEPISQDELCDVVTTSLLSTGIVTERDTHVLTFGKSEAFEFGGIKLSRAGNVIASKYNKAEAIRWWIERSKARGPFARVVFVDDCTANVFNVVAEAAVGRLPTTHAVWYPPPSDGRVEEVGNCMMDAVVRRLCNRD